MTCHIFIDTNEKRSFALDFSEINDYTYNTI